jgi:hypothetical protein
MTYQDHLHPWCIVRLLPEARSTVVARFRHRTEAEAHLKLLNQLTPSATYQVFFESITDISENLEEREAGE